MTELLAPAGDIKSFDAAIACGANAVYLGLGDFNARMKAENFDAASLREVVKKAHFFGVKVFVTINTIVQKSTHFWCRTLGCANCLKIALKE